MDLVIFVLLVVVLILAYQGLRKKRQNAPEEPPYLKPEKKMTHQTLWPGPNDRTWDAPLKLEKIEKSAGKPAAAEPASSPF